MSLHFLFMHSLLLPAYLRSFSSVTVIVEGNRLGEPSSIYVSLLTDVLEKEMDASVLLVMRK